MDRHWDLDIGTALLNGLWHWMIPFNKRHFQLASGGLVITLFNRRYFRADWYLRTDYIEKYNVNICISNLYINVFSFVQQLCSTMSSLLDVC